MVLIKKERLENSTQQVLQRQCNERNEEDNGEDYDYYGLSARDFYYAVHLRNANVRRNEDEYSQYQSVFKVQHTHLNELETD